MQVDSLAPVSMKLSNYRLRKIIIFEAEGGEMCDEKTFLLDFLSLGVAFGWRRKKWKRASGFNLLIAALKISSSSLGGGKQIKTIHTLIIQNRIPICLRSIELQANGTQRA